jgi:hypothetical protein
MPYARSMMDTVDAPSKYMVPLHLRFIHINLKMFFGSFKI